MKNFQNKYIKTFIIAFGQTLTTVIFIVLIPCVLLTLLSSYLILIPICLLLLICVLKIKIYTLNKRIYKYDIKTHSRPISYNVFTQFGNLEKFKVYLKKVNKYISMDEFQFKDGDEIRLKTLSEIIRVFRLGRYDEKNKHLYLFYSVGIDFCFSVIYNKYKNKTFIVDDTYTYRYFIGLNDNDELCSVDACFAHNRLLKSFTLDSVKMQRVWVLTKDKKIQLNLPSYIFEKTK